MYRLSAIYDSVFPLLIYRHRNKRSFYPVESGNRESILFLPLLIDKEEWFHLPGGYFPIRANYGL